MIESNPDEGADGNSMRLQKYLAHAGCGARRKAEELILSGHVTVNGETVDVLGTKVDPDADKIALDGRIVKLPTTQRYIILNKPGGYVTTMHDPQHRPCVASLVPVDETPGLFAVGRLDCDTTGLLLFTDDGGLSNQLLHPRFHVAKCYEATLEGHITEFDADRLRQGIVLDDGPCKPAEIEILRAGGTSEVTCTITEGRKHQVKRMFAALGLPVLTLNRASFGPLTLGDLELGKWRDLSDNEVAALRDAVKPERGR